MTTWASVSFHAILTPLRLHDFTILCSSSTPNVGAIQLRYPVSQYYHRLLSHLRCCFYQMQQNISDFPVKSYLAERDLQGILANVIRIAKFHLRDEQLMGDTVPASFYRVSAETDPANYVGRMTTTMGPGNPADQMISQQASVDALNPGTFSDDNVDASQNPDDCCSDADGESSSRDDKFDRADDDESNHDPSEAHASTNPSILQRASFESKETESQGRVAGELEAIEGCESPAISGDMGESGEVVATGNTASPGPSNDSGPASIVPTSTIPTNTNTIPTHTVAAEHASQRRVRHHARKAQPKKYGVNTDNGKKGGS